MRFMRVIGIIVLSAYLGACDPAAKENRGQFGGFTTPTATVSTRVTGPTQLYVGESAAYQLVVTTTSGFSSTVEDGVSWRSSNLQVLNNGENIGIAGGSTYTAMNSGAADVEVWYGNQRATLRVTVTGFPEATPPPTSPTPPPPTSPDPPPPTTPAPPAPQPEPAPPAAPGLDSVNGTWNIRSQANPDPCAGFPFNYDGTIAISGVRSDGTGGSAVLNRAGSSSPMGSTVTVRREGSRLIVEFTARLALGGNFYDYTMRWELDASGRAFTGTQTLSGPCQSTSTVQGTRP